MKVKKIIEEDFNDYKLPSMFIAFPFCTFKCERESGIQVCQNKDLDKSLNKDIPFESIVNSYINNPITSSIVMGGLEPFDSYVNLLNLVHLLRKETMDDIVIYTGYYKNEIEANINQLKQYKNIIVKFGRYMPNYKKHYDEILGVYLASDNQYAERIS